MKKYVLLENWSVTYGDFDPYIPPECRIAHLQGNVTKHPKLDDGFILTSAIEKVKGSIVTTHSGTMYKLGTPNPEFVQWCKDNGVHVPTKRTPIKIKANKND